MRHDAHVTAWLRHYFRYDQETGLLYWTNAQKCERGNIAGTIDPNKHIRVRIGNRRWMAQRIIWQIVYGYEPENHIDHIDGDWMNNRLSNLREATHDNNMRNIKKNCRNKSGAKGVTLTPSGKFMANITYMAQVFYIGIFDTLDEAAHMYNKFAIQLHGEFARLNPIGVDK